MGVPVCLILFLHFLQPTLYDESDPCHTYTVLNDTWRATTNLDRSVTRCDSDVQWQGWYRMFHQEASVLIPNVCVPDKRCGTDVPLWLNGSHPRPEDGIVTREVCGHWLDGCCDFKPPPIQMKACPGNYTVYKLVDPLTCSLAYCADVTTATIPAAVTNPAPTTPSGRHTTQGIFYPFGSAAGDTFSSRILDGSSPIIPLLRPLPFFGRMYQQIFVNHHGHITFNQSLSQYVTHEFPANSTMDIIAPFWTDLDNRESGNISYQQYTSGDALQTATQDISSYFPNVTFTASWVFVATWDRVAYYPNTGTENTFQVVLISDSKLAFILMNYGDIAPTPVYQVQIGYDTISSTLYGSLRTCYPNNSIDIVNLKTSSNVNVQGRWAFLTTLQSTSFSCTNTSGLPEPQPGELSIPFIYFRHLYEMVPFGPTS
ncbi:uncharacterized protein LOC105909089 [Clupea harengus]|uniref:Uncharacterized protein LOC105909089 n=1 Tax=Clupea harengus TaxID=7950 RepID=A0A6P8ECW5_CLUHA|nr:uncharacterized protein LOC105909089 [Clupea harengus]